MTLLVYGAVEGYIDEAVLRRIVADAGASIYIPQPLNGKQELLERLPNFNKIANSTPWIVFVDLDEEEACVLDARNKWLPNPAPLMCFRIAVQEIESWLLADREQLAAFLSVQINLIPAYPEQEPNPKRAVVDAAKRSAKKKIYDDMVPRHGSSRDTGPAYASRMEEFARDYWRPEIARQHSESLDRCLRCIDRLIAAQPDT